jgi:hypothetical protein
MKEHQKRICFHLWALTHELVVVALGQVVVLRNLALYQFGLTVIPQSNNHPLLPLQPIQQPSTTLHYNHPYSNSSHHTSNPPYHNVLLTYTDMATFQLHAKATNEV